MKKKFGYIVDIHSFCYHSVYSNEQYGDWEESYNNDFSSIRKAGKKDFPDVNAEINFKPGTDVYVVWIERSEGDSFGWADRRGTDVLAVFDNKEDAVKLETLVNETEVSSAGWLEYLSLDGQHLSILPSWIGYFDKLEAVHIELATMGKEIK